MRTRMYLLQAIVALPEYETLPNDPDSAIDYLANWDYGEYSEDPEWEDTLTTRYCRAYRKHDYVLRCYFDGTNVLYRIIAEE